MNFDFKNTLTNSITVPKNNLALLYFILSEIVFIKVLLIDWKFNHQALIKPAKINKIKASVRRENLVILTT